MSDIETPKAVVAETQLTSMEDDGIAVAAKDDAKGNPNSIETPVPTGKPKRKLTDKQKEALTVGRKRRHDLMREKKPDDPKLDTTKKDDLEKNTETLTRSTLSESERVLHKLQKRVIELERKREKDKIKKKIKEEIKKHMFERGGGPLNDAKVLKSKKEVDDYKADKDVPAPIKKQTEFNDYTANRKAWSHAGLIGRCFR